MSRGFLIFANNNEQIDYGTIALSNALMVRANSTVKNVSLVTDQGTKEWLLSKHGEQFISDVFDQVIVAGYTPENQNRNFKDTNSTTKELKWNNFGRSNAYDLSPYDETVVLDADYLIMDRTLDHVWGSLSEFMINKEVVDLEHKLPHTDEIKLEITGIPMYWATCFYFKKTDFVKSIFEMVKHVKDHYQYYQHVYRFPGRLFRNDYAFSIALHTLSGCVENRVDSLPSKTILTSFDKDELVSVVNKNELRFLVNDRDEQWRWRVSYVKNINVHVMNKFSLSRMSPEIIKAYR